MFDLKSYLSDARRIVDDQLLSYLGGLKPEPRVLKAMNYSVMAGGKRLRPLLCMAAAEAIGSTRKSVMPLACALELIHTYSLIHDDLPAMDDDNLRRGKPTCHVMFDEATAILAGDALLTLAFEILADAGTACAPDECGRWFKATARIASAAGFKGMIEGQIRDMEFEGTVLDEKALESLHRLKTGRLIEASVASGALVAGASKDQEQLLSKYAREIGLAEGLRYVYTGNLPGLEGENTYCPQCGTKLISRTGFRSAVTGMTGNSCSACTATIAGIFT